MAKTYGQFCGLARALDHIGDRWTLLIIRELLVGPAGYGQLLAALSGIPTNLLAERLRQLEEDEVVVRQGDPDDRRRSVYRLTPLGGELEPAVLALVRWGTHWMRTGPGDDRFHPRWLLLALRALLGDRAPVRSGVTEVRTGGQRLAVTGERGGGIQVAPVADDEAEAGAVVEGDARLVLGLCSGEVTMTGALRRGLRVRGDRSLARALLQGGGRAAARRPLTFDLT